MWYLIPSFLLSILFDFVLYHNLSMKQFPYTIISALFFYTMLINKTDNPAMIAKGLVFAQLLLLAGFFDALTHEIPDTLQVLIFIDGLIQIEPKQAFLGFFIVSVPLLVLAIITSGGVGGGDIKLMAACGWVLGPYGVIDGSVIGLLISIPVFYLISRRNNKDKTKMYAMAPCLGIGCFIAYLMS